MPYYLFIGGQRYDASLINNAKFRTRGQGDGRISETEAQELWRQVMDGGRITEVEESTLHYILENFNWTDKARQWMETEMTKEVTKTNSYYKVIDGLRYDRAILERAEALTQGRGDGRISLEDAQFLLPLFGDAGDVRIEEERTLQYLLEHYSWTDKAREWFLPKVDAISKESNYYGLVNRILKQEFDLERLSVEIGSAIVHKQTLEYNNRIEFPDAFRRALASLFTEGDDGSFQYLVMNIFELYPGEVDNWKELRDAKIRELLNGEAVLALLDETTANADDDALYNPPQRGETFEENWILGLWVPNLSDHYTFIVVARDGSSEAFNYAFN